MRVEQSRAEYIDIAKGIGIILVVFGHLSERTQMSRILIYSFHMPLFFIISGYLEKSKKFQECFVKGFKRLVIPAYIVLLVDIIFRLIDMIIFNAPQLSLKEWMNGFLIRGGVLWNAPVWFLLTLFLCRCIKSLVCQKNYVFVTIIVIFCVILCMLNLIIYLPEWWLTNIVNAFPFYYLGIWMRRKEVFCKLSRINIFSWCVILVTWIGVALINGYTDINIHLNGKSYILFF